MENKQQNSGYAPTSYYPYGELPLKYTKQGQQQLKASAMQGNSNAFTKPFLNESIPQTESPNKIVNTAKNNENNNNQLNINNILPLFKNMGGDNELIGKIMPMLSGNGNLQLNDLIKLFTGFNKTKSKAKVTIFEDDNTIENLTKID